MSDYKKCSRCGHYKPANIDHFQRNASRPDGFAIQCKACLADMRKDKETEDEQIKRCRMEMEMDKPITFYSRCATIAEAELMEA